MNHVATMTNGSAIGQVRPEGKVPQWLAYLVAAYPTAKNSPMTYVVLTDQFQGIPGEELYEASRLYVREGGKWFPSAFEFRPFVERVQAEAELNQTATRWQATVASWPELRARRTAALEMWYEGELDDRELLALAGELELAGLLSAAANLQGRVALAVARGAA